MLPLIEAAERKLTESCLNSWPVCGGAGQLWVLPWQGEVEPSGRWKAPLLSVSDSPQPTLECLRKHLEVPDGCDAVPKFMEQEQDVMPTRLLPLRAQQGVTALAGFLDCLWGLCQNVPSKALILLVPASHVGFPTLLLAFR